MVLGLVFLFGLILGLMLMVSEDGVSFVFAKKLMCRLGLHKIKVRIGRLRINKYYCQYCKRPRKHPDLKIVDGGNKVSSSDFKF